MYPDGRREHRGACLWSKELSQHGHPVSADLGSVLDDRSDCRFVFPCSFARPYFWRSPTQRWRIVPVVIPGVIIALPSAFGIGYGNFCEPAAWQKGACTGDKFFLSFFKF